MWKCIHTLSDFLVFGIGFLISGHGFIDCSVNEGGSAFTHALSVFLNDGYKLWEFVGGEFYAEGVLIKNILK